MYWMLFEWKMMIHWFTLKHVFFPQVQTQALLSDVIIQPSFRVSWGPKFGASGYCHFGFHFNEFHQTHMLRFSMCGIWIFPFQVILGANSQMLGWRFHHRVSGQEILCAIAVRNCQLVSWEATPEPPVVTPRKQATLPRFQGSARPQFVEQAPE